MFVWKRKALEALMKKTNSFAYMGSYILVYAINNQEIIGDVFYWR